MPIHLLPCPSCARHVRASEPECPFCGVAIAFDAARARPPRLPTTRLGRGATLAFGAAVATTLSLTGCAESEERSPDASVFDAGGGFPVYGGPDSGPEADGGPSVADDAAVAGDGGSADDDAGAVGPLYGGPTPVDAGGGAVPAYGAPPES